MEYHLQLQMKLNEDEVVVLNVVDETGAVVATLPQSEAVALVMKHCGVQEILSDQKILTTILAMIRIDRKLDAIKHYRVLTNKGLVEAKNFVEHMIEVRAKVRAYLKIDQRNAAILLLQLEANISKFEAEFIIAEEECIP